MDGVNGTDGIDSVDGAGTDIGSAALHAVMTLGAVWPKVLSARYSPLLLNGSAQRLLRVLTQDRVTPHQIHVDAALPQSVHGS